MKPILLLVICCTLTLFSCGRNPGAKNTGMTEKECRAMLATPDSLKTDAQRQILGKAEKLIKQRVEVKNNRFTTTLTEKDFTEEGLPGALYGIMIEELENTNEFIAKENLDAKQIWENSK